jgi:tetratricopeptide (TPR) repeat protein
MKIRWLLTVFLVAAGAEAGTDPSNAALAERLQALEARVQALEQRVPGAPVAGPSLRDRFQARMAKDRATYTEAQLGEIEELYQVANRQWNSPEAQSSLKKLVESYGQANRTGCAILYLGQMSDGADKERYLKQAAADFADCWYGDGVQVGAYARFYLANYYQDRGDKAEAARLYAEIRQLYPDAVNHKGRLLSEIMPR